jgi:hypothetical protein
MLALSPSTPGPLLIARYLGPFTLAIAQLAYEGDQGSELAYRINCWPICSGVSSDSKPRRPDERHPRCLAGHVEAALGPHHSSAGHRRRLRVRECLRRVEVRPRGLDGIPAGEVAPFGITTTIVNPGFFRTELLTEQSTNYAEASIADYDERRGPLIEYWKAENGQQSGTRRSSRVRSSRLRARNNLRAVSSPAPMPLPRPSRKSLI